MHGSKNVRYICFVSWLGFDVDGGMFKKYVALGNVGSGCVMRVVFSVKWAVVTVQELCP
jgi:hypothetical protein